jgi:hypothetical protein
MLLSISFLKEYRKVIMKDEKGGERHEFGVGEDANKGGFRSGRSPL